jgi:hypothetical protein
MLQRPSRSRSDPLVGQRFHIVPEDRAVIRIGIKVKIAPGRAEFVFDRAQQFMAADRKGFSPGQTDCTISIAGSCP